MKVFRLTRKRTGDAPIRSDVILAFGWLGQLLEGVLGDVTITEPRTKSPNMDCVNVGGYHSLPGKRISSAVNVADLSSLIPAGADYVDINLDDNDLFLVNGKIDHLNPKVVAPVAAAKP